MGKQTMGTPVHNWKSRSDNKLYRIQNPQAALVQTKVHKDYLMDEYPQVICKNTASYDCFFHLSKILREL